MKRAVFRLQSVLELRRAQERAAAVAAAQAAQAAAAADRRARGYEEALAAAAPPGPVRAGEFLAAMTRLGTAAADASAARSLAQASEEQAELVREQWTVAAQRAKGLERLRERHDRDVETAAAAAEERAVDDLTTGRAGRRPDREVPWTE